MVDTLVQSGTEDVPQSIAQTKKYRVETRSYIRPYVVRDHAWSNVQHDEMNSQAYQTDAPDGYTERMDYGKEPYNAPRATDKAPSKAQSSVPGAKNITVVQHKDH